MAEAANANGNGNGRNGSLLATLGDRLMRVLPPAMLVLILLNIAFLGTTMWLVQHNADYRNQLLTKIVENCLLKTAP